VIERVTFHNDDSGFCVLRVKAGGQREETTVVGSLPSVTAGEWLSAEGWWIRDKEHGRQFKATSLKTVPPTTAEGIERYLGSGLVKGIGPIPAKKLVGRFGAEVLSVIENRAAELQSVDGIGPKRRSGSRTRGRKQNKHGGSCCSCTATASTPAGQCESSRPMVSGQSRRCRAIRRCWLASEARGRRKLPMVVELRGCSWRQEEL
jgi:ATP-dependent exoDNAse (exonuclease V) alpha subunit